MTFEQYLRDNFINKEVSEYRVKALIAGTPQGPLVFGIYPNEDSSEGGASYHVVGDTMIPIEEKPQC